MSAYQYHALNNTGGKCRGIILAESERQARRLLRDKALIPTKISIVKTRAFTLTRRNISTQELALFTRQLATLLAAKLPIDESLHSVAEQSPEGKVRQLINLLRAKIIEGFSLAQAMEESPQAFSELYRATVAAGEQTGRLDLILAKLADYTEKQQETRQKVQNALIYPILMLTLSSSIIGFLLAFVIPKIIDVFQSSGQTLPIMTKVLLTISSFLQTNGLLTLICLMIVSIALRYTINKYAKYQLHTIFLKLPIIGRLIRAVNVARYTHTFAMLFNAGVSVLDAMRVSSRLVNNIPMRMAFEHARVCVREGVAINHALKDTKFLSPMANHLIASGEKSGQIADMMERAAEQLDTEVQQTIDTALTLLEPLIILIMGGIVLFIVLSTLLPIFSMEQLV